jgi:hypothetical protein
MNDNNYTKEQFLKYFLDFIKYILKPWTNDIYKFRTVNSHVLIDELTYYLNKSIEKDIFNNNIIIIIEELYLELIEDVIYKSKNWEIKELISPFIKYINNIIKEWKKELTEKTKKELLIRLNSIQNLFENKYLNFLENELIDLFDRKINNEKITWNIFLLFEKLINSYFTEVLYIWLSKRELLNIIYEIDDRFINNIKLKDSFFSKIKSCLYENNKITTYLKISLNKDDIESFKSFLKSIKNFKIDSDHLSINNSNIYNTNDLSKEIKKIKDFFIIKSSKSNVTSVIFKYSWKWIDCISQWNKVKKLIDNVIDFLKWEFPKWKFDISPLYISYSFKNKKYYSWYYYLDHEWNRHNWDQEYLEKRLDMFKRISNWNIDEDIEWKLFTMLKYYRLCLNSSTYEERFLNLWIWWEHIFSNNINDKTWWNNIQKYVPYILTINHINDNLWLLIKWELSIWKRRLFFDFMNENRIYKEDLQPSSNLYIILQDEKIFNKLISLLWDNLIWKWKLLELRNNLFIPDNKKIGWKTIDFLEKFHKKISMKLYRMNRIRNSIVHTWKNDFRLLEYTTSQLEKYYLSVLEDLLEHFTLRNWFSLDDYFLRTERSYENFLNYIKSDEFKSNDIKTRWIKLTSPKIIL